MPQYSQCLSPAVIALMTSVLLTAVQANPSASPRHSAPAAVPTKAAKAGAGEKKSFPKQAAVAAGAAFASVPSGAAIVTKALNAKDLAGAGKMVGKSGAFQGTVSKAYSPRGNGVVVLDFAPDYKAAVTAVVKPDTYAKFPDLSRLEGKRVLITGKFVTYHDAPQIVLTNPSQVKLIH